MDEQNNGINRSQPVLIRVKIKLDELRFLISKLSIDDPEAKEVVEAIDDIQSLLFNSPVASEYGLSVEQMMTLAESQLKTAAHNVELEEVNQTLRDYIVGLEKRLELASKEAIDLIKKKGL